MDVPDIVRERLGDERRMTSVNVGGDDRVYVTPPRTLVYRASGLFSREEIEEYPHDARRFDVSADRREASFAFEYDDGVSGFSVPRERIETVLPPVLAGVLRTTGLIESEESIEESYRFGDRTLVVTEARTLTSVGEAVWDDDHESYEYADVTDLRFADGTLVVELDGRPRRIELDGDERREAYETVEAALLAYHGVASVEELPEAAPEQRRRPTTADETRVSERTGPGGTPEASGRAGGIEDRDTGTETGRNTSPPSSPAPTDRPSEPPIREAPDSGGTDPSGTPAETAADAAAPERAPDAERESGGGEGDTDATAGLTTELDALRESVERQTELLERQQETLERLVEKLDDRRPGDHASGDRREPDTTEERGDDPELTDDR